VYRQDVDLACSVTVKFLREVYLDRKSGGLFKL
jgi:hypothetical protein